MLVLRHRRTVLAVWAVVLIAGVWASMLVPNRLVNSFSVPGTESERAAAALERGFGERPDGRFTIVFPVPRAPDARAAHDLRGRLERLARVLPGAHVASFRVGNGVVYGELETALSLQQAKGFTERLRRALRQEGPPTALVTGLPAVQHDLEPRLASDLRRGEAVALVLAFVVLAFVLGISLALAIPFAFAACTIAGTVALLYVFARVVAITPYALNLVELIGLGLAVDYSLIIVCRYREQLALGQERTDAIVQTMKSAGRAVVFSGFAVAIGLALLLLMPVPFVRTMGLAGLLIPLVSVAAAVTLQPVLLSFCGPRAVAGIRLPHVLPRGAWATLARAIMRRPVGVLLAASALLLAMASPALSLDLTPGSVTDLPRSTEAARGLEQLRRSFGPGALTPTQIVVDGRRTDGAREADVRAAVERLSDSLFNDPEVYVVALGREQPYISPNGRYARVLVVGRHDFGDERSQQLVTRVRKSLLPAARFPAHATVAVGGAAPEGVDFLSRAYAFFPWLVAAALGLTYVVLTCAFRSLLLPLKAIALNLLSVGASYGLLVAIFGSGEIEGWVPIFLFATLFGLSMDYEVFLVSRMREAWDAGHSNAEAIALGLERTGGLITAAALVMAASFAGLIAGGVPGLRQLGLGLSFAVVIDATLVRGLLVPAIMAIMGRWNWWLPARLRRRKVGLVALVVLVMLGAPGTAAASPTVRLAIRHVVQHCHVWRTSTKTLGASAKLTLKRGTHLVIRADCPMDFDFVQKGGPKLALGNPRTYAGSGRVIVFRKAGVYRLQATNVQTPEERGLVTLGDTNTLFLTVVVK
jgi:putative drug exporter of the RND superfamily